MAGEVGRGTAGPGRRAAFLLLLLAVVLGLGLRLHANTLKRTITHDEGVSYLAATGHQRQYTELLESREPPFGSWASAADWTRFLLIENRFCFGRISWDLAHHDIHPPLFFWILHVWSLLLGVSLWTGMTLNILISLITAVCLFGLAAAVLGNRVEGAVVALVWAVAPYTTEVSLHTRPYDLLALWTVLLTWGVMRVATRPEGPGVRGLVVLALVVGAGALTHYQFLLVAAGGALAVPVVLGSTDFRRTFRIWVAIGGGFMFSILLNPHFLRAVGPQQEQVQPFAAEEVLPRLFRLLDVLGKFFIHHSAGKIAVVLFTGLVVVAVPLAVLRRKEIADSREDRDGKGVGVILFLLVWLLAGALVPYVLHITPHHAMGQRYLSTIWPFLAFVPVLLIRLRPPGSRRVLLRLLCGWQVLNALVFVSVGRYRASRVPTSDALDPPQIVVLDNVAEGILPGVVWQLEEDAAIFAADQRFLLDRPDRWRNRSPAPNLYVSRLAYGNTQERRDRILAILGERHTVTSLPFGLLGHNDVYAITSP